MIVRSRFIKWFVAIGVFSTFMNLFLLAQPIYLLQVFDRVITTRSHETLAVLTLLAVTLVVSMIALDIGRKKLLIAIVLKLDALLSTGLVRNTLDNALGRGSDKATLGDLLSVKKLLASHAVTALFDAPWTPVFLGVIYYFHPVLGHIALLGVVAIVTTGFAGIWIDRHYRGRTEEVGKKADTGINEALSRHDLTYALGMTDAVVERWREPAREAQRLLASSSATGGSIQAVSRGMRQLLQIVMIGAAAWLVINLEASSGILIAATILFGRMLAPVELFISSLPVYLQAASAFKRLHRDFRGGSDARSAWRDHTARGWVEVKDLVVRAPDDGTLLLKGLSFEVRPGESLAVVGAIGAGKTTLAKTLIGVLPPFSGHALIDHSPVHHWSSTERGKTIGYLPQNSTLFAGTVAENIARMQKPDEQAVMRAARMAGVDGLVRRLPNGYDTELGANGRPLSAGEQQRIALARAVYGDPRVVVLDEPNASVDSEGERALFVCLDLLKQKGVTVIVITHRPGILTGVDRVAVMRRGVITNISTADKMLKAMQNVQVSALKARRKARGARHAVAH